MNTENVYLITKKHVIVKTTTTIRSTKSVPKEISNQ
jgi:hypothetical protein